MKSKIEALTHMLGHGLNHLIKESLIDINSTSDVSGGYSDFNINGIPARVSFYDAGHGEFSINVHFDFNEEKFMKSRRTNFTFSYLPITSSDPKNNRYTGAVACCWVERKDGKWLQLNKDHKPFGRYIRKSSEADLMKMKKCKPNGFKLNGKFYF